MQEPFKPFDDLNAPGSSVTAAIMRAEARMPVVAPTSPVLPASSTAKPRTATGLPPDVEAKAKQYAASYRRKHPNVKPERLMRIVANKFNINLTTPLQ